MSVEFRIMQLSLLIIIIIVSISYAIAWKSRECPIDSQDYRETYHCIRPCDFDDYNASFVKKFRSLSNENNNNNNNNNNNENSENKNGDDFFIVFFPSKQNEQYERSRFKCPAGFRQTRENEQCFCERPYTPYELEMQRREKCDHSFERCRMYGVKPYDCNHVIETCPSSLIREYCLAGKVFKMRFARVVYEFCHLYLRLPNDGRFHLIEPHIDRRKH